MATLRTWEEKSAILAHCIELEKEGGDILAYLWSENYLTPRATWFNFQREWLGRKPYEYTDGKPKKVKKEKKQVNTKQKMLTDAQRAEVVRIAIDGGDPKPYIGSLGFKVPSGVWHNVKEWYKRNDPETFDKIPDRVGRVVDRELPKVDKGMPKKLELDAGGNYQLSVAEDQMDKLVIDQTNSPVTFGDFEVTAVRHPEFGEFYFDQKFNRIDWRNPEGDEVSFAPGSWKRLTEALPQIMGILGVKL